MPRVGWNQLAADVRDATAAQHLAALPGPFLPWTDYAMRPSAILAVLTDVALAGRRRIVELGSGNSTVYLARLLRQRAITDARVLSVDHDASWASATRQALEREGLAELVEVAHAPLGDDGWYHRGAFAGVDAIDLLVIDGPPAWQPGMGRSREPALDHLAARLTDDATVILDDAHRPGEQDVLAAWQQRHGRTFTLDPAGYAVSSPWT